MRSGRGCKRGGGSGLDLITTASCQTQAHQPKAGRYVDMSITSKLETGNFDVQDARCTVYLK